MRPRLFLRPKIRLQRVRVIASRGYELVQTGYTIINSVTMRMINGVVPDAFHLAGLQDEIFRRVRQRLNGLTTIIPVGTMLADLPQFRYQSLNFQLVLG